MAVLTVISHVKALARLAEEENMKKEDEQFLILTVSGRPPYNSFWTLLVLLQTGAACT